MRDTSAEGALSVFSAGGPESSSAMGKDVHSVMLSIQMPPSAVASSAFQGALKDDFGN